MLIFLTTLLGTLSSVFRSQAVLALEKLSLRHQIGVLQRSARKRCHLTPADRMLWVWLSRLWGDVSRYRTGVDVPYPEGCRNAATGRLHAVGRDRFWRTRSPL